jgi:hypothetical protein
MKDSDRGTRDIVRDVIERDGSIKIGLARGLINARALARYIQVLTHERYTFEALLGAIRRYPIEESAAKRVRVGTFIEKMTTKNRMVHVLVQNGPGIPLTLARFSEKVDYGRGDTFHSVTGTETVSVIIDSKNLRQLQAVLPKSSALKIEEDLAELVITLSGEADRTIGVNAALAAQLAMNGIDIREYFDTPHTIPSEGRQITSSGSVVVNILVEQRDAMRAYQALEDLSKER